MHFICTWQTRERPSSSSKTTISTYDDGFPLNIKLGFSAMSFLSLGMYVVLIWYTAVSSKFEQMQKCKCHLSKSFILIVALILATFSWRVYLCLANILPKVWICFSFLLGASKCINIITNYGERSWGRDLEEKNETFLLLLVCCCASRSKEEPNLWPRVALR